MGPQKFYASPLGAGCGVESAPELKIENAAIEERIGAFPSKRLSVGGKTLAYRESGEGRPLVLLHGIVATSAWWLFQLEDLREGYRVVAWDAPGYGESDAFAIERPRAADYAHALSVLVNALRLKDFAVVAHSFGALVACAYARMVPSVARMLLISPFAGNETEPATLSADALELARWNDRHIRDGYRQASYCLERGNLREDAPHYLGKVLVACGSADRVTPEAECRELAACFPNASYTPLPGLRHAPPLEGAVQVNSMIREFA